MRITEAARRLGISPRMLRYRDSLGLLPAVRERPGRVRAAATARLIRPARGRPTGPMPPSRQRSAGRHRHFGDADLDAVRLGLEIEQRYDVSPAALAFGLRVLTDLAVRAQLAELGRRLGRSQPPPARAIDFEKERALRLLGISDPRIPAAHS